MVAEVITSTTNERIIAARRLHDRKGRRSAGAMIVEGPHATSQAIAAGAQLLELFATEQTAAAEVDLIAAATLTGAPIRLVADHVLARVAETVTPQGIVAIVAAPVTSLHAILVGSPQLLVLLDAVADPGNAGTVIRTADAAGADGVLLTVGSADVTSGKAVRSSAGSLFNLPVADALNSTETVKQVKDAGLQLLCTTGVGDVDLDALIDAGSLNRPTCWIFGNEAHGVGPELSAAADHRVRISMRGKAESLNLAAAAAVCLFASARVNRH